MQESLIDPPIKWVDCCLNRPNKKSMSDKSGATVPPPIKMRGFPWYFTMLTTTQPDTRSICKIPSLSTTSATYWAHRSGAIYMSLNCQSTNGEHVIKKAYTLFDARNRRYIVASNESGCTSVNPVAELVAEVFLPKPKSGQGLMFIDGDRMNCASDNLRWV
jgi:hypothetical protein